MAGQGLGGGGARASVPGGVGGRGTGRDGANFATCVVFLFLTKEEKWRFLKDALWGGGGTHRSWPGGRGGRPRALVAGERWGGRRGWMAFPKKGAVPKRGKSRESWLAWQFHRRGHGLGGNPRALVPEG